VGEEILLHIQPGVRLLVVVAFLLSVIVAATHWAIRRQKINAFSAWARFIRRISDPLLAPVEKRMARSGANPQEAPIWLVGLTVVAGLVLIAMVDWILSFAVSIYETSQTGGFLVLIVHSIFELLKIALMIRVVASWLALNPYSVLMRIVFALTNWIIEPLQKIIPPVGMLDFSVLVAYLMLSFAESVAMRSLF
jgi:YggT family protein